MTHPDEPTQRLRADRAREAEAPMPGPLDLTRPSEVGGPDPDPEADETRTLHLDEMFETEPDAQPPAPAGPGPADQPLAADATTWTAMPVVPLRPEPVPPEPARPEPVHVAAGSADRVPHSQPAARDRTGSTSQVLTQLRGDAIAAWNASRRRGQDWIGAADHALALMTALVGILLIVVVATTGS